MEQSNHKEKGSHTEGMVTASNLIVCSSIPSEQDSGKARYAWHGSWNTRWQPISSCVCRWERWSPAPHIIYVQRWRLHLLPIFPLPTKEVCDHEASIALAFHSLISLHKTLRLAFKIDVQTILNDLNALSAKRDRIWSQDTDYTTKWLAGC